MPGSRAVHNRVTKLLKWMPSDEVSVSRSGSIIHCLNAPNLNADHRVTVSRCHARTSCRSCSGVSPALRWRPRPRSSSHSQGGPDQFPDRAPGQPGSDGGCRVAVIVSGGIRIGDPQRKGTLAAELLHALATQPLRGNPDRFRLGTRCFSAGFLDRRERQQLPGGVEHSADATFATAHEPLAQIAHVDGLGCHCRIVRHQHRLVQPPAAGAACRGGESCRPVSESIARIAVSADQSGAGDQGSGSRTCPGSGARRQLSPRRTRHGQPCRSPVAGGWRPTRRPRDDSGRHTPRWMTRKPSARHGRTVPPGRNGPCRAARTLRPRDPSAGSWTSS